MCTAATYKTKDFYFGRTLDYEFSYGDEVTVTPRNYPFRFRLCGEMASHYAIIGMACVVDGYPLYYDAVNEKGLCIAGLNFVGNAFYKTPCEGYDNIAQFELIPWLLGGCSSVAEARKAIGRLNLVNLAYSDALPVSQLHWIIADKNEAIVMESVKEGIKVYDNPVGVLTNNPPFEEQMFNLNNYMHLSRRNPTNSFCASLPLKAYSRGMGALGLPGDLSSQSRFVRAAFTKMNSCSPDGEAESVSQFFHILGSVDQQRGCCELNDGEYEITLYTSCCNADRGIYYYRTYNNSRTCAVDMHRENLNGTALVHYKTIDSGDVLWQN